jgi:erythromycin esterase
MWANEEVADFGRWLRAHNLRLEREARVGFHGMDMYSLWESMREILVYLREHHPELVATALAAYRCFEPFGEDPQRYAIATRFVPVACEDAVIDLLRMLRERAVARNQEEFSAWQNAEVVLGAERYYRAMVAGGPDSWNIRDEHMADTIDRLLEAYGPGSKAVIWAHNTHVGDARATTMASAGMVNIGQVARERHGDAEVVLMGFGCHRGSVIAARSWGASMEAMPVPRARPGALESELHAGAPERALFVFPQRDQPDFLTAWLDHRAIGVVYDPGRESWSNYVPTKLGERYDAFGWFDQTKAVHPIHVRHVDTFEPETFPAGV